MELEIYPVFRNSFLACDQNSYAVTQSTFYQFYRLISINRSMFRVKEKSFHYRSLVLHITGYKKKKKI